MPNFHVSRTDPEGEPSGEPGGKRDFSSEGLLEHMGANHRSPEHVADGSMESIDEHCKNFATSSWTQFKVGLKKEEEKNTGSGAVYPDVLLHNEG